MVQDTEEARVNTEVYPRPLKVIEGPLMKVGCILLCTGLAVGVCCGGGGGGGGGSLCGGGKPSLNLLPYATI